MHQSARWSAIWGSICEPVRIMATWFTADLHFGHHNIIKYCNRPFSDVRAMNDALIQGWNGIVAEDDIVWIIGDFALGKIAETLPLVAELHGHKILVAGNHDRCWSGHGQRAEGWTERYLDAGFDRIVQGSTTIDIGGEHVRLCHFPYRGDSHDQDRFQSYRPVDNGEWLLHGHVHERWAQDGRMINVGVDVTEFSPISIDDVAAVIRTGPAERATYPSTGRSRRTGSPG
jgi:calcineurin-like phosphoesterase family protein